MATTKAKPETLLREFLVKVKPLAEADWHYATKYLDGLRLLHQITRERESAAESRRRYEKDFAESARRYDFDTGEAARRFDARAAGDGDTPESRAEELAAAVRNLIADARPV